MSLRTKSSLTLADFDTWDSGGSDINLDTTKIPNRMGFIRICKMEVKKGMGIALGTDLGEKGEKNYNPDAGQTTLIFRFDDGSGQINGSLQIAFSDPTGMHSQPQWTGHSSGQDLTNPLDRTKNPAPTQKNQFILEDGWISLWFKPDSATTLDVSDTDNMVQIPITIRYDLRREFKGKTLPPPRFGG